ncbi:twin-arginine translocase subunit TatC [Sulfobacillus thermosulfidooxidans]|uniref:Sec-independent protein translocase protein TatC n=2 Tax=Sulfobacillus thermosulfidooxidans TaxID=28034 RepID=A0A1W1W6G9_SULTA|nr:twin-arginine translocase subunit TatC [Sulfobacillus thermosulfidooxidans]OLZ09857.1 twin arginine-targeting protein translocase TatC [Sulfobacillus thermosulfidooxidans]OLZ15837.1 twin arginine-targeting protein translocase TatC [Sulfobacillus thermosulfidooxidans]OLZ18316.1 twin arginine-targeting protein translocase TatC [Sulfobacillus thermosulfidooxidans]PSR24284.1 MAG: twin-arginine translocase subunit TatC [Sulfobacillus thermosulfidooxidans]SMC01719.1 sec-independent protein transl
MDDKQMTLTEHLTELRNRLFVILGAVAVVFLVGFFYTRPLLHWIIRHTPVHHVIVTGVTEAFFALIKLDLAMSLILTSPIILYEIAAFILPGLTQVERRVVGVIVGPGLALFLIGTAVGYFVFVPIVLHVMLSFTGQGIEPMWRLGSLLSFIIDLSVPFGIVAELPLISGVMSHLGLVQPIMFSRYRRYAILLSFFIAAILAPPDALSMTLMALPIYLVYEISALVARFTYKAPVVSEEPSSGPSNNSEGSL